MKPVRIATAIAILAALVGAQGCAFLAGAATGAAAHEVYDNAERNNP